MAGTCRRIWCSAEFSDFREEERMEELLKEILGEMKMQTQLLERLVKISDARDLQTGEARELMKKATEMFKGTPFDKIIGAAIRGGGVDGK
jgi:hypothetical protein